MDDIAGELAQLAHCFTPTTSERYRPVSRYVEEQGRSHQTIIYEVGWEPLLTAVTPRGHPELAQCFSRLDATVWITLFKDIVIRDGHRWVVTAPDHLTPRRQVQALLGLRGDFASIDRQLAEADTQWRIVLAQRADYHAA